MKLLTATAQTQGQRASDYTWCTDGELVTCFGLVCARDLADPDGGCGCGRGFPGLNSHKATTTAIVRDIDGITFDDLVLAVRAYREHAGWSADDEDEAARQAEWEAGYLAEIAASWPAGTVLERRLDDVQPRRNLRPCKLGADRSPVTTPPIPLGK